MDFILDHLAIASYEEASTRPGAVDALLCVAAERAIVEPDRAYHKVPIIDMQPIPAPQMAEAVAWIDRHIADERILVFCNAGIGRSSSVVVGYLCCFRGLGFGEAVERVASRHPNMSILPMLIRTIAEAKALLGRG